MSKESDNKIKDILRYSTQRNYFGDYTQHQVYQEYQKAKKLYSCDGREHFYPVKIGHITTSDICDALWTQMSYNPERFGQYSPFKTEFGDNNLERFVRRSRIGGPLGQIRYKLYDFMETNGWQNKIITQNGYVNIGVDGFGHSYPEYKKLKILNKLIKFIADQNLIDYKMPQYHDEIVRTVNMHHPEPGLVVASVPAVPVTNIVEDTPDWDEEMYRIIAGGHTNSANQLEEYMRNCFSRTR